MKKLKKAQAGITIPQQPGIDPYKIPTVESWYGNNEDTAEYRPHVGPPDYRRQFNPMMPNAWGLGLMGAYVGTQALLNQKDKSHYQEYKARWIRNYSIPSLLQDPNKFSSIQYEAPMAQKGGTPLPPIYTSNPNDPRLRAYQDSLKLHNTGEEAMKWAKDMGAQILGYSNNVSLDTAMGQKNMGNDYGQVNGRNEVQFLVNPDNKDRSKVFNSDHDPLGWNYSKVPHIKPLGATMVENFASDRYKGTYGYTGAIPTYKKPVQPVELKTIPPKPTIRRGQKRVQLPTSNLDMSIGERPSAGAFNPPELYDPTKPTSYNYTTGAPGQQQSTYLPDAKSWRQFIKGKKLISSEEGVGYGTAAGYQTGGMTMRTPQDQGAGYFKYPTASSLTFPGRGQRTFVPGPFPLIVQDQNGTQLMTDKPVRTMGKVKEIPIFAEGGEVRTQAPIVDKQDATIEAEKGELILGAGMPGDVEDREDRIGVGLYRIGGKTHAQGGTPLKAYPGDFVFSNDKSLAVTEEQSKLLIGKEVKKLKLRTPAKLANKYIDLNKFIDMAQDADQDPISKKTAMLNVNNFVDRLAEIALVQEEKKGFPDGVPQFVQASLETRFNAKELQDDLNQFRYGGQVPKAQLGIITPEVRAKARQVDEVPAGYNPYGVVGDKQYYRNAQGEIVTKPAPNATKFETDPYKLLRTYGTRKTNPLNQYSYDDLLKQKYVGQDKPELREYWKNFYTPPAGEEYVYTHEMKPQRYNFPSIDIGPRPTAPNRPGLTVSGDTGMPSENLDPLDNYVQGSNSRFNMNIAEAYGALANNIPSKSRYPPAFRNWEIQNAKALVASNGRPISEQPYLNAIARSNLGYDAANYGADPVSATRNLGAYGKSLEAQNSAISQVYNQNILRGDQRDNALAQLEVADGQDRVAEAKLYDSKVEMLANNKEMEARNRRQNNVRWMNQYVGDREKKTLLNMMSDYYQINPDNTVGMKPTYKIIDGKLVPHERNIADLIRSSGTTTDTRALDRMRQVFELMQQYNIRSGSFVDELVQEATNPYFVRDQRTNSRNK